MHVLTYIPVWIYLSRIYLLEAHHLSRQHLHTTDPISTTIHWLCPSSCTTRLRAHPFLRAPVGSHTHLSLANTYALPLLRTPFARICTNIRSWQTYWCGHLFVRASFHTRYLFCTHQFFGTPICAHTICTHFHWHPSVVHAFISAPFRSCIHFSHINSCTHPLVHSTLACFPACVICLWTTACTNSCTFAPASIPGKHIHAHSHFWGRHRSDDMKIQNFYVMFISINSKVNG